jgi:subtilase family serine protease
MSDVNSYFSSTGQSLNVPINNVLVNSATAGSGGDDTEQVIDIVEAVSMAPALSQVRVYIAPCSSFSGNECTNFAQGVSDVDIFNKMATENIAKQLSVSFAWSSADTSSNDPIFKEFAVQGQSLFVASGDSGAYVTGDLTYPAEDPLVTAVGGTDLVTNGAAGSWSSETGWSGSGGGTSLHGIAIPNYQAISGVITSQNHGSTTLRNIPDVAAEANTDNFGCANGTCFNTLGGTSLAAPTWAGFMALVNQQAALGGQAPVGFLNPPIYDNIRTLHDITSGSNGGETAVTGYDLVTGWGSPSGSGLITGLATNGSCGYVRPGGFLPSGATVTSCDGRFELVMQSTDGNLVLYFNGSPLFNFATNGNSGNFATMQDDGNFVVYSPQGTAVFNTQTGGGAHAGAFLAVQSDGNLVVYDPGLKPLWNSMTGGH